MKTDPAKPSETLRIDPLGPPPLAGLVLTGGRSLRMGFDKSTAVYHDRPQVEVCWRLLQRLCGTAFVSTRAEQAATPEHAEYPRIGDHFGSMGPMDGVLSAFETQPTCAWLVLACDLPFLGESLLRHLIAHRNAAAEATAFRNAQTGQPEPLCAIYEPRIRSRLLARQARGLYSLREALAESDGRLLDLPEAHALDNINTRDEFRAATRRLASPQTEPPA